jgi:hypothetical protein
MDHLLLCLRCSGKGRFSTNLGEYWLKTLVSPSILLAFKKYYKEYIFMKMARLYSVLPYLLVWAHAGHRSNLA